MNETMKAHMHRGRMRLLRLRLLCSATYTQWSVPRLLTRWVKCTFPVTEVAGRPDQKFRSDGTGGYETEETFDPNNGAWVADPRILTLWINARQPGEKRRDHGALLTELGFQAAV